MRHDWKEKAIEYAVLLRLVHKQSNWPSGISNHTKQKMRETLRRHERLLRIDRNVS